jgi:hypothetical protein
MFFSFNSRALDKTSRHNSASWEELTVEDAVNLLLPFYYVRHMKCVEQVY